MAERSQPLQAEQFRRNLREKILRGELRPGQVLESERQLTATTGLSLARIRSALASLAGEGLIVREQGRGSFVADPLPKQASTQTVIVVMPGPPGPLGYWRAMDILHGLTERYGELSLAPQLQQITAAPNLDRTEFESLLQQLRAASGVIFLPFSRAIPSHWRILPDLVWVERRPCARIDWLAAVFDAEHQVPSVDYDRRLMGKVAAGHAVSAGYTRLAYLGPNTHVVNEEARLCGFVDALVAAGLPLPADYIVECPKELPDVRLAVSRLMACRPSPEVVCCSNDRVAGLALQAVTEMGLRVPGDVALVAFTDSGNSELYSPISITTGVAPYAECGRAAVQIVKDLIDGKPAPKRPLLVPPQLIVGESCPETKPGGEPA